MTQKMHHHHSHQTGLSLLETILVMVIASIITLSILLYYKSAQRSKSVDAGLKLIEQIIAAADNYQTPMTIKNTNDGVPTMTDSSYQTFSCISTSTIAQSGFIPQQYLYSDDSGSNNVSENCPDTDDQSLGIKSPWFSLPEDSDPVGTVTVVFDSTTAGYDIIFDNIPNYACSALKDKARGLKDFNTGCTDPLEGVTGCDDDNPNQLTLRSYPAQSQYCDS